MRWSLGLIFIHFLASASPFNNISLNLLSIRGHEQLAKDYCDNSKQCTLIASETKEFSNGNTFVRLLDSVSNGDVAIVTPNIETLTANQFMELLIKIRTAFTLNARSVGIIVSGNHPQFEQRKFDLLRIAGATWHASSEDPNNLVYWPKKSARLPTTPYSPGQQSLIVSDYHSSIPEHLSNSWQIPQMKLETILGAPRLNRQIFYVDAVTNPVNENLFKTLSNIQRLKKQGHRVVMIMPYFAYSRSDKVDQFGVTTAARLIADLIEASGADVIGFARLHAPQVQGFFEIPSVQISGRPTINRYLASLGVEAIVSPDAGFQKDASLYADELKVPVYVLNKQRDPQNGHSSLRAMGDFDIAGKRVAVIDDETSSGSTLHDAAQFLKSRGALTVYGVVTHLAGSAEKALKSDSLDQLVVTDTIPTQLQNTEKFKVLSIGNEFADSLKSLASHCARHFTGDK